MKEELRGQRALVLGASKGIGAACAEALAGAGARVTTVARTGDVTLRHDVLDPEGLAERLAPLGPHEIVVYAAGGNEPTPFLDVTAASFDRLLALNLRAGFFALQHAARALVQAGRGGSLIVIGSQMGHVGAPDRTVYCATKHAVEGMVKAAAVELAPHGIRVNAVAPAFTRTALVAPLLEDAAMAKALIDATPLGRLVEPEEVASAILFLASDDARMVTGHTLPVDGGWLAR